MEHNTQLDGLIGAEESTRLMGALQRAASWRSPPASPATAWASRWRRCWADMPAA
jgi:hypothetical protein